MRSIPACVLGLALWFPLAAGAADAYDPRRAGHPLRIAAYALHPVGVILDYLIFRPAWFIGGFEPIRTLVGREPELSDGEVETSGDPVTP